MECGLCAFRALVGESGHTERRVRKQRLVGRSSTRLSNIEETEER